MESLQKNTLKLVEIIDDIDYFNDKSEDNNNSSDACSEEVKSNSSADCDISDSEQNQEEMQINQNKLDNDTKKQNIKKTITRFDWVDIGDLDDFNMNNNFLSLSDIVKKDFFYRNIEDTIINSPNPFSVFSLFFTEKLWEHLTHQTNLYAKQQIDKTSKNNEIKVNSRINKWKDITSNEMKTYIGIILWMSVHKCSQISDHWSTDLLYESNFHKFMSYNKFINIHKFFHTANNDDISNLDDSIYKIRQILVHFTMLWRTYYEIKSHLAIDEAMIKFDGRLAFKQYMKQKPTKWGIKAFLMCDSMTGYCYKLNIYYGKDDEKLDEKLTKSENIILRFMNTVYQKGITIYCVSSFICSSSPYTFVEDID